MQGNDHSYGYHPFHYSYAPSEVWRDCEGHFHELSGQPYPTGDTPVLALPEPSAPDPEYFDPMYGSDDSLEVWCGNAGFPRCATYPGGPAYLTNISIPLSQVSYLHPPWRFVAIRSTRHTSISQYIRSSLPINKSPTETPGDPMRLSDILGLPSYGGHQPIPPDQNPQVHPHKTQKLDSRRY